MLLLLLSCSCVGGSGPRQLANHYVLFRALFSEFTNLVFQYWPNVYPTSLPPSLAYFEIYGNYNYGLSLITVFVLNSLIWSMKPKAGGGGD